MGTVPDRCDHCRASYRTFRSGLTFATVRIELRSELHRQRVTRHTVLGRMHEHKIMRWGMEHGIGRCVPDPDAPSYLQPATATTDDDQWFAEGSQVMPTPTEDTEFPPRDVPADVPAAPVAPIAPPVAVKRPRVRKASIVEAIADAITSVEAIADAAPKTTRKPRKARKVATVAASAVEAAIGMSGAPIVAARVFAPRLRHFWCVCGRRGSSPIGAAAAGCVHRAA